MQPWKKTGQAIEMVTDHPLKGKMKRTVSRMERAQLKSQLTKDSKSLHEPGETSSPEFRLATSLLADEPYET